jgi:hypothetical protein
MLIHDKILKLYKYTGSFRGFQKPEQFRESVIEYVKTVYPKDEWDDVITEKNWKAVERDDSSYYIRLLGELYALTQGPAGAYAYCACSQPIKNFNFFFYKDIKEPILVGCDCVKKNISEELAENSKKLLKFLKSQITPIIESGEKPAVCQGCTLYTTENPVSALCDTCYREDISLFRDEVYPTTPIPKSSPSLYHYQTSRIVLPRQCIDCGIPTFRQFICLDCFHAIQKCVTCKKPVKIPVDETWKHPEPWRKKCVKCYYASNTR